MKPIIIYDDNQSCIVLSKKPVFHAHMKHIKIHYLLVQKKTEKNFVKLVYYNTKNIIVVILTKGLSIDNHEYFRHFVGAIKCVI
jgi:hypothetical protein